MALCVSFSSKKKDVVMDMDQNTASSMLRYIASHQNDWSPSISQEFVAKFQTNIRKQIKGKVAPFCNCLTLESFTKYDNILLLIESIVKAGGCVHNNSRKDYRLMGFTPVHIAAGIGNVQLLSCLMDNQADMYSVTKLKSLLPFELAVTRENLECAKLLIDKGFRYPVNKGTLFNDCIKKDNIRAAQCCLDAGVPVREDYWAVCMKQTLDRNALATTEWLLNTGLGVGSANHPMVFTGMAAPDGTIASPLHYATSVEMVELLVENGANPTQIHCTSTSVLTNHIIANRLDVCEAILSHFPTTALNLCSDPKMLTQSVLNSYLPLHHASWRGNVKAVDLLLRYDANCHAVTGDGNTALGLACHVDSLECVRRFVAAGSDPNASDKTENTALIYATFNGNSEICKLLLENGADAHVRNSTNVTPLWNAIYSRSLDIVEQLLLLNVDYSVPCQGLDIHTASSIYDEEVKPVFVAIHHEQISILKALLSAGCYLHRELSSTADLNISMYLNSWAPDNKRWLGHVTQTPPSLSWWCKRTIRLSIKSDFQNSVKRLDLTYRMKSYIIG